MESDTMIGVPMKYYMNIIYLSLFSLSAFAHDFVVLPESQYKDVVDQCSRAGPLDVTGSWEVSIGPLQDLEDDIEKLNELVKTKAPLSEYFRQYIGVIIDDVRYIYINATINKTYDWTLPIAQVNCDGGARYFGVLYNTDAREFSNLEFNGF